MNNGTCTPFVPYYPMLTLDTYAAYKTSLPAVGFSQEQPAEGIYYPGKGYAPTEDGNWARVDGYKVLPANWQDSFYWTCNALSNLMDYGNLTDDQKAAVNDKIAALQQICYAAYDQMKADVAAAENTDAAAQTATAISMQTAQQVHEELIALVNSIK